MIAVLPRDYLEIVCDVTDVSYDHLMGPQRLGPYARARQLGYYLLDAYTPLSLAGIGRHMGRDHTTVMSGVKRAKKLLETNQEFRDLYNKALAEIGRKNVSRETQEKRA